MSDNSDISPELAFERENAEKRRAGEAEDVFSPRLQSELLKHEGKWAAITRARLIAVGDTPAEALKLARKKGFKHLILYWIPEKGTTYIFVSQTA